MAYLAAILAAITVVELLADGEDLLVPVVGLATITQAYFSI